MILSSSRCTTPCTMTIVVRICCPRTFLPLASLSWGTDQYTVYCYEVCSIFVHGSNSLDDSVLYTCFIPYLFILEHYHSTTPAGCSRKVGWLRCNLFTAISLCINQYPIATYTSVLHSSEC